MLEETHLLHSLHPTNAPAGTDNVAGEVNLRGTAAYALAV